MKTKREMRDEAMREKFPAEQYELFGKLVHAIVALEDLTEQREFIRWHDREGDWGDPGQPTYEQLDAQVCAARSEIVNEAINLAMSGGLGRLIAKARRSRGVHLVVAE